MNQIDTLIEAVNNIGKPTYFEWLKLSIDIVFSIVTGIMAFLTYRLQKKVKEADDNDKKMQVVKHASGVYYFLYIVRFSLLIYCKKCLHVCS